MRGLMLNKDYRAIQNRLETFGIELVAADSTGSGSTKFTVKYEGITANAFHTFNSSDPRGLDNTVTACKKALRGRGASIGVKATEDRPGVAKLVEPGRPFLRDVPDPAENTRKTLITRTRLNDEEKRDFYLLYESKAGDLLECCETYRIHPATGAKIITDFQALERDKKRMEAEKKQAFTLIEPEPQAPQVKRLSPLDPRLLELGQRVELLRENASELQTLAHSLGLVFSFDLNIDWD